MVTANQVLDQRQREQAKIEYERVNAMHIENVNLRRDLKSANSMCRQMKRQLEDVQAGITPTPLQMPKFEMLPSGEWQQNGWEVTP
jgi:multidrug resistance efflux pump